MALLLVQFTDNEQSIIRRFFPRNQAQAVMEVRGRAVQSMAEIQAGGQWGQPIAHPLRATGHWSPAGNIAGIPDTITGFEQGDLGACFADNSSGVPAKNVPLTGEWRLSHPDLAIITSLK